MDLKTLGITRQDVLDLAAQKLAEDATRDGESIFAQARDAIQAEVKKIVQTGLAEKVDTVLAAEMEKILAQEIIPCDIWGDRKGKATTIKAVLADRARDFWFEVVNADGKISNYGGKPRYEWLFTKTLQETFQDALRQNAVVMIETFKAAVRADLVKAVEAHVEKLIPAAKNR